MKKTKAQHLDNYFVKRFTRYCRIDDVLDSDDWIDLEERVKKVHKDNYKDIMKQMFSEFKFYNYILKIEYAITDSLNSFLKEKNKIKNWDDLKNRFLEKIQRNKRCTEEEAEKFLEAEVDGKIERILTPHKMLYCAEFGIGELIDYISTFTDRFLHKKSLVSELTKFNKIRILVIHNLLTSRKDLKDRIKEGILSGKEVIKLIDTITSN